VGEDEIELNIDKITPGLLQELTKFVSSTGKKKSGGGGSSKAGNPPAKKTKTG